MNRIKRIFADRLAGHLLVFGDAGSSSHGSSDSNEAGHNTKPRSARISRKLKIRLQKAEFDASWGKVHAEKVATAKKCRDLYGELLREFFWYRRLEKWKQSKLDALAVYFRRENLREQLHDQDEIMQDYIAREVALSEKAPLPHLGIWSRADGTIIVRTSQRHVALHTADMVYRDTAAIVHVENQLVLWTDASGPETDNTEGLVGMGVVCKSDYGHQDTWDRLLSAATYQAGYQTPGIAELRAVASALGHATKMTDTTLVQPRRYPVHVVKVFSDSCFALRMIRDRLIFPHDTPQEMPQEHPKAMHQVSSSICDITAHTSKLVARGIKLEFNWVPGHSGIEGNCRADRAANRARKARKRGKWLDEGTPVVWHA